MRRGLALTLAAVLLMGCGSKLKRLSPAEQSHYYALKVWMTEDQRKQFLKLKTEEERNAYLQDLGLWESFYQYDADTREQIVAGEVEVGWTEDKVLMAWGAPYERRRLTGRPYTRSELFVYRFEVDADGYVRVWAPGSKTEYKAVDLFQRDVHIDDGRVTEILDKDDWE